MRDPRIVVVGDLILDLLAKVEGEVAFGTDTFTRIHAAAGGSGANAAAWLAASGIETHFIARIGDDLFGRFLAEDLRRTGVEPHLALDSDLGTGKVFVLVDGAGERTMITDRGAGEALGPEDLPSGVFSAGHLHLSGYTLSGGSRRETALKAQRLADACGMTTSVDPSSVSLLEALTPERFLGWTRGAEVCFPNLQEGALLTGYTEPDRIADALLDDYGAVVLKLGPDGALYADVSGERARVPAAPARVVDTTGAGDALCAGFLATRLSGGSPSEALLRGVEFAARAVEEVDGRPEV
ncbi:MAG TPA: sugar kinase [Rubrobacteraceae bacterium]|nr:sugar kinase [Rubrobacteraceae bacterium]